MNALDVGTLKHDVMIQALTDGVDNAGAPQESWENLLLAPMARDAERSSEAFKADQMAASIITRWTMRYHEDMDPDLIDVQKRRRLVYNGRIYDVMDAQMLDRQVGIVLRTLAASRVDAA